MSPTNKRKSINIIKLISDPAAKESSSAPWTNTSGFNVVRVSSHHITKSAFMRNLNFSVNDPDLINSLDIRTEPRMNTQNFIINNSRNIQIIKDVRTVLSRVWVSIFPYTFIIKPINLCNLPAFMVSS